MRECEHCGLTLSPSPRPRRFCSTYCGTSAWYAAQGEPLATSQPCRCVMCDAPTFGGKSQRGPRSEYCSAECKNAARTARARASVAVSTCAGCPKAARPKSKFCSVDCRLAHQVRQRPARACEWEPCGSLFVPLGRHGSSSRFCCKSHKSKFIKRLQWPDGPDGLRNHRKMTNRRGRMLATEYEVIDPRAVFERDDWRCYLCSVAVSKDVPQYSATFATLDHVIPLSKGGAHTYANIKTACFPCNTRKGNRLDMAG